eukprot:scaffold3542_cov54-Phaeocystis_antarctica.AAC.2
MAPRLACPALFVRDSPPRRSRCRGACRLSAPSSSARPRCDLNVHSPIHAPAAPRPRARLRCAASVAAVKQLYLSGQAGGAGLRELLAHNESLETDQPEFDLGRPAPASASGSAPPTFGRGARDAAG